MRSQCGKRTRVSSLSNLLLTLSEEEQLESTKELAPLLPSVRKRKDSDSRGTYRERSCLRLCDRAILSCGQDGQQSFDFVRGR